MALIGCTAIGFAESKMLQRPGRCDLYPLSAVRLLPSEFSEAVEANRQYLLALDTDRLLAPFRREAGLTTKKPSYGNWENIGLDGHTAGHYLSALATMISSGHDTSAGELERRLDAMLAELEECQLAGKDGYIGGVPGSKALWEEVANGEVDAVNQKWVPWYNVHKTFAGLRDATILTKKVKARQMLIRLADWAEKVVGGLSEDQMQRMLRQEHGGMNESLADVFSITGNAKYLRLAEKFSHRAILDPLSRREDRLTGLHANTQIPKVIGFQRIAGLEQAENYGDTAKFFWDTVIRNRSVAFGGNSVSEHFNDPADFSRMVEHREGPETCNTYNMLRLTERLFCSQPDTKYMDYYERALYNHILASINPKHPGYVYFTPIRPGHYRVYSQPEEGFWCCVGTGMENPGRYGQIIYSKAEDGLFINLFLPSVLTDASLGLTLKQETAFPNVGQTKLTLDLNAPKSFALRVRHPGWVSKDEFVVTVNGTKVDTGSSPSSFAEIRRVWKPGDTVQITLPMRISVEPLPDTSDWATILYGPIVLAREAGKDDQEGLFAGAGRGDHIAFGPLHPIHEMPTILSKRDELPSHVERVEGETPLTFKIRNLSDDDIVLKPLFRMHETRYQMLFDVTTPDKLAARKEKARLEEMDKLKRDQATIDRVAVGEQQPEQDHEMTGEGLETGMYNGRRWRHGKMIQYTLSLKGRQTADLAVTYSGDDVGRTFDIDVNGVKIASEQITDGKRGRFFEVRYVLTPEVLKRAREGKCVVRFVGKGGLAGGLYDVRLLVREQD
jgi:DUF1680 family protein